MPKPKTLAREKNLITRIETNKRYVTDIELRALSEVLGVSYAFLMKINSKRRAANNLSKYANFT